jgi:hypothetical protein
MINPTAQDLHEQLTVDQRVTNVQIVKQIIFTLSSRCNLLR